MRKKSRLLLKETPLVINVELATIIGLNEAIVLQQIEYWINTNTIAEKDTVFKNDYYWTYGTIEKWNKQFPFWSYDTIKRTLKKLRDKEILITDNFNEKKYDRTIWYRIDYDKLNVIEENYYKKINSEKSHSAKCPNEQNSQFKNKKSYEALKTDNSAKCPNGKGQNAPMEKCTLPQPIQETTKEIKEEIKTSSSSNTFFELEKYFEDNICELKKTTRIKFKNWCLKLEKNFIKAIIEYGAETNAKSYKWFDDVVRINLNKSIDTVEKFKLSVEEFKNKKIREINKKRQYNENKKIDTFNNFEQRKYNFDQLEKDLLGWNDN